MSRLHLTLHGVRAGLHPDTTTHTYPGRRLLNRLHQSPWILHRKTDPGTAYACQRWGRRVEVCLQLLEFRCQSPSQSTGSREQRSDPASSWVHVKFARAVLSIPKRRGGFTSPVAQCRQTFLPSLIFARLLISWNFPRPSR